MPYPSALDTFPGTSTQGTTQQSDATDDHALQHRVAGSALGSIEQVIGTTNGTAIAMNFAAGDFATRINAGGTLQQPLFNGTWTSGTFNNGILGTPKITGGSISSVTGTATTNNIAANWLNAANGTAVNIGSAAAPTVGQVPMATSGSAATWQPAVQFINSGTQITGTTASATPVDAGIAATVNPGRAVNIKADICGRWYNDAASGNVDLYLLINGTVMQQVVVAPKNIGQGLGFSLSAGTNLASGLGTVKMQFDTSAGTVHVEGVNLTAVYG